MFFNSIHFALFFPIVFIIYWFAFRNRLTLQNVLLLFASYYFYSCWDWRFLFLLLFSTLLDYYTGLKMYESTSFKIRQFWFWMSIIINLGFLGIFKYYNFFANSFGVLLNNIGFNVNVWTLKVILPVGISFYTFHGLSYVIDIYKNRIKPERNFLDYSLFVSFFPLLVAGPIERATHLLPQIKSLRKFEYSKAVLGVRQILWGLVKKVVIADQCAEYANIIFNNQSSYSGSTLLLGAVFFAFQIYGDFSGYSDIALGTARLLGFELLQNFNFPYFSRDVAEFWRRWHISLSTWFKDYLYIPLGGSKGGFWTKVRNTFIIFIVSGFWHGANWTFIVWGGLNALYIMPSIIFNTNRNNLEIVAKGKLFPTFKELISIISTFLLTVFAWIFFRSETIAGAICYFQSMFSMSFFSIPYLIETGTGLRILPKFLILTIFLFLIIEWLGRSDSFAIAKNIDKIPVIVKWFFYLLCSYVIFYYSGKEENFIYFQF